jgi:predicted nucleic acid-binding protein
LSPYWPHLVGKSLYVGFASVAELYRWALKNGWGARRIADLRAALRHYTVLVYDDQMAWRWAEVMSISGVPVGHGDAWVAAAALRHGLSLVTHNRRDFERIPSLTVISEA